MDVRQREQELGPARVGVARPFLAERVEAEPQLAGDGVDDGLVLVGVHRADAVYDRAAGPHTLGRGAQQLELQLGQRPDLRWRAAPLPDLQLALLRSAAERVKPGGTIVYSVCTLNADENEAVVDASGLEVLPLTEEWPQYAHPSRPEFLLTMPHRDRTSGFFIARLRAP